MNIYTFTVSWKYSSYNFIDGIIKADTEEEALEKLKQSYPDAKSHKVYEAYFDDNGILENNNQMN
jgi:hypothetical protein